MFDDTAQALKIFTTNWCQHWHETLGHGPFSADLFGIPSPCVVATIDEKVLWQPEPFQPPANLDAVARALEIEIQPSVTAFYTTQFAGEMTARIGDLELQLSQVWSPDDFSRTQENLIGHLLMKRRLKQTPTLFIATTRTDLDVVSVCNLTGEVISERLGTRQRRKLSDSMPDFLSLLQTVII